MSSPPSNFPGIDWPAEMLRHESSLRNILRKRLGYPDAVDDVFQEIATAAFNQSTRPTDPHKVAPWLHSVAVRQAADYLRRQGRQERLLEDYAEDAAARDGPEVTPRDWLLRTELNETLTSALWSLPAEQQEILNLKYIERLRYQDLAERLGTTIKGVEHRLSQARKALRNELAKRQLTEWTP